MNPVASFGNASPRVQAHVDTEGQELPYSVHFAHVSVRPIVLTLHPFTNLTSFIPLSLTLSPFALHSMRLACQPISCRECFHCVTIHYNSRAHDLARFSYLKLFESSLFSLPVERPEGVIGHEEVVTQLTELTVDYDSGLGLRGEFSDVFQVYLKVEQDKYSTAIGW